MRLWRRRAKEQAHYVQGDADLPIVRVGPHLRRVELGDDGSGSGEQIVAWEEQENWIEVTCSLHGTLGQGDPSGRAVLGQIAREHATDAHGGQVQVRGWMR